jgi:hypothetical protein
MMNKKCVLIGRVKGILICTRRTLFKVGPLIDTGQTKVFLANTAIVFVIETDGCCTPETFVIASKNARFDLLVGVACSANPVLGIIFRHDNHGAVLGIMSTIHFWDLVLHPRYKFILFFVMEKEKEKEIDREKKH